MGAGMVDHLATVLSLSAAQKATATELAANLEAKAAPLFAQHKQQWAEVEKLLAAGNPDAAEVGQKVIAAHETHAQLKALHEELHGQLAAILSADQKAKFTELAQMHQQLAAAGPGHPSCPVP